MAAPERESEEVAMSGETTGKLPHLLVVGAGNSLDPGPVRLRQEAKRGARRRRRHDRRRDRASAAVTSVFLTPPGLRGTRSQECGRSWRKEVQLPKCSRRRCFAGSRSAAAVRARQDRVRRPPRYPRYRTGPTVRHRRGRGCQEVTRTREISLPVLATRRCNFPTRGGSGDR